MNKIIEFLKKNGFKSGHKNVYYNGKCTVVITLIDFEVYHNGYYISSPNLEIYWLIGYLTYNGLIDKNYIV